MMNLVHIVNQGPVPPKLSALSLRRCSAASEYIGKVTTRQVLFLLLKIFRRIEAFKFTCKGLCFLAQLLAERTKIPQYIPKTRL